MHRVMWSLNIPLDIRSFAIASRLIRFMKVYVMKFFAYAVCDLSNYLVSQKRIEVICDCENDDDGFIEFTVTNINRRNCLFQWENSTA